MTVFVGIDPGASGGAVFIDARFRVLNVYSTAGRSLFDEADMIDQIADHFDSLYRKRGMIYAVLEQVGAAPKQGSASTARLCSSMGLYWGMLIGKGFFKPHVSARVVRPTAWRRGLGITSAYDKKDVHSLVKEVFKDDAVLINKEMADAAAIAVYCRKICRV